MAKIITNKVIQYSPQKAYKRLGDNPAAVLIDVRCTAENKFVGRPLNSILVPWLEEPDWSPNLPEFVAAIKRAIGGNNNIEATEIILICRSGYRSDDAGKCLIAHNFTNIAHIIGGFEGDLDENNQRGHLNGWRHNNLPWEQC